MQQVQHGEPSLAEDLPETPASPDSPPESPEFGKVHVIVTPPSNVPSLHTPEFGQTSKVVEAPAGSPKFGFTVPASPNFGVQSPESPASPAWPTETKETKAARPRPAATLQEPEDERQGAGEPHPSTPDFGSLNNAPLLDDVCKLSSAASSPHGSSHENSPENASDRSKRISVDMLLPSPASPNGVSKEFAKTGERVDKDSTGHDSSKGRKFDFPVAEAQKANSEKDGNDSPEDDDGEKEDLFQECIYMQRELKRREEMLNWFYEELEATSAELKELQESQSSRSELSEKLEEAAVNEENLELKLKRLQAQMQEQSVQALEEKLHEAKQLRQEEAVTKTLRLENDDLASELRDLYDKLAETQRTAEEVSTLRIWKQEAAALGDALERAEADALGRAAALKGENFDLDKLAQTQDELKQSRLDSAQNAAKIHKLEDSSAAMTREMSEALQALAESQAQVEEITASEWKAAQAFDQLAEMSRQLSEATALADSEIEQRAAVVAASRAHSAMETAKFEEQTADLAAQLQVANAAWKDAESRLSLTELCSGASSNLEREELLEARIHDLEGKVVETASSKQRVDGKVAASEMLIQHLRGEIHEEISAKHQAEVRLAQVEKSSKSLDSKLALATACEQDAEVHLTQEEEMRWDLERQLERESRSSRSIHHRLEQAEEAAESSGQELGSALAARQMDESRLSSVEAVVQQLEASLAHAETRASSESQRAILLQAQLGDTTLRLDAETQRRKDLEAHQRQLQGTTRDSEAKLDSAIGARENVEAQLQVAQLRTGQLTEEIKTYHVELHSTKADVAKYQQLASTRAIEMETSSELQANLIKLQKSSEKLQDELATEMKLATSHKALVGTLEMEVETEKQGRASAQEAFGKVTDSANSLECQLASACATAERLKALADEQEESRSKSSAALSLAQAEQADSEREMEELRQELLLARQQRRAAMQASQRAQMARLKQQEQMETVEAQAVTLRKQSELDEAARSASLALLVEEHGTLVREQHAELLQEVRECHAMVARRTAELSESQEESYRLKHRIGLLEEEANAAQKLADSEERSCSLLLQQLEEVTVQSIEAAREPQPEVPLSRTEVAFQLRDELAALQVRQLQDEAAAVRRQLQEVQGAAHVLAGSLSGGDSTFDYDTPMRRITQRGQVSALPLSASVGSPSPMSSLRAQVGSQWPLPWGPPPAKAQDLLFSQSSSPASSSRPLDISGRVSHKG